MKKKNLLINHSKNRLDHFLTILSRFVFLIEGQKKNGKSSVEKSKKIKK